MSILINYDKITGAVNLQHFSPDTIPPNELANLIEEGAIYVNEIPKPNPPTGQVMSGMFIDTETKAIRYEYIIPPATLEQQLEELQTQNAQMIMALVVGGLM